MSAADNAEPESPSRRRLLTALGLGRPDRLPATTHHVLPCFLEAQMGGISYLEFFERFGLDPILWVVEHRPDESAGHYRDPGQGRRGFLEPARICSDSWRLETEELPHPRYRATRHNFVTPERTLTMVLQSSSRTSWVTERLIKDKRDIELIDRHAPAPLCDVAEVNRRAEAFGGRGIVRGHVPGFDVYGQPGCWQDAAVLFGIENLILETFYDPTWVRALLGVLARRKAVTIRSMRGARFDLVELGGGDASTTVISPKIFEEFVAPWDAGLIELLHGAGLRVVYHTCGGMMPILEAVAGTGADAMETFTPPSLGGDVDLAEAKRRIGSRVCMIGGFDQSARLKGCGPEETRRAVRRCFEAAGTGGGYILAPSDHFFEADPELLRAFAEEARACAY